MKPGTSFVLEDSPPIIMSAVDICIYRICYREMVLRQPIRVIQFVVNKQIWLADGSDEKESIKKRRQLIRMFIRCHL